MLFPNMFGWCRLVEMLAFLVSNGFLFRGWFEKTTVRFGFTLYAMMASDPARFHFAKPAESGFGFLGRSLRSSSHSQFSFGHMARSFHLKRFAQLRPYPSGFDS